MKETKFNVWNKKHKFMDTAWLIDWEHGRVCHSKHNESELSDCILLQYTGIKDENGKEIYDGDILSVVEVSENNTLEYVSPVEYVESGFLVTEPNDTQVPLACFHNLETTYPLFEIKIIGTIYENPDLLGGK